MKAQLYQEFPFFVDVLIQTLEGPLLCRVHAGQLFGLLLIPTPVFGVDSTPQMGGWVGGWDGVILG